METRLERQEVFDWVLEMKSFNGKGAQPKMQNWFAWNQAAETQMVEFYPTKYVYETQLSPDQIDNKEDNEQFSISPVRFTNTNRSVVLQACCGFVVCDHGTMLSGTQWNFTDSFGNGMYCFDYAKKCNQKLSCTVCGVTRKLGSQDYNCVLCFQKKGLGRLAPTLPLQRLLALGPNGITRSRVGAWSFAGAWSCATAAAAWAAWSSATAQRPYGRAQAATLGSTLGVASARPSDCPEEKATHLPSSAAVAGRAIVCRSVGRTEASGRRWGEESLGFRHFAGEARDKCTRRADWGGGGAACPSIPHDREGSHEGRCQAAVLHPGDGPRGT